MGSFDTYYNERFRHDLQRFLEEIPDKSKHHDSYDKGTYYIQYERLTKDKTHLDFLKTPADKVNFGIALFLTILVDEVCYTYYKQFYPEFKALTNYPEFIGNCPAGCNYHFHPSDIFLAMNYGRNPTQEIQTETGLISGIHLLRRSQLWKGRFMFSSSNILLKLMAMISGKDVIMNCLTNLKTRYYDSIRRTG